MYAGHRRYGYDFSHRVLALQSSYSEVENKWHSNGISICIQNEQDCHANNLLVQPDALHCGSACTC